MSVKSLVKAGEYQDSVRLMLAARELAKLPGVEDAAVLMATEANKAIMQEAGLLTDEAQAAGSNDLVVAVKGAEDALEAALENAEKLLRPQAGSQEGGGKMGFRPKTIRSALKTSPLANMAVISVAGRYAASQAWEALRSSLHVLLFSDNVSLEDEIALKKYAAQKGLLLMGPGAGTAIINGVGLGFANKVPAGEAGIVSAAGTGLQEVSSLLAQQGVGISQALGTGGRDLKEEVGGIMMLEGLKALQADPATQMIILISKPPAESVAKAMLKQAAVSKKHTVVCFLGGEPERWSLSSNMAAARTLQEAALLGAGIKPSSVHAMIEDENHRLRERASEVRLQLSPEQHYLRGLFSGGTLCYEAQVVWRDCLSEPVFSNAPLVKDQQVADSSRSTGCHTAVDLGEEEFTVGRPHPMMDNDLRIRRLQQEARDPQAAVIMLDVVLGYGAHPDPASELGPAIRQARQIASQEGRELMVVASLTGTPGDPQGLERQRAALIGAGAMLCASNAAAARLAAYLVSKL